MTGSPRHRTGFWLVIALGLLAGGCGERSLPFDDPACARMLASPDHVDAFAWLEDPHGGEKWFGSWSRDQTLAFCHRLEAMGASQGAVAIMKTDHPEPSQRAGGLVAVLPEDLARRRHVFEMWALQVRGAGYRPVADSGQKYLYFPSDMRN